MVSIAEDLDKFLAVMHSSQMTIRCAVGSVESSIDYIHHSRLNALEAYQYFFLYQYKKLLSHLEISERMGLTGLYKFNLFENALKAGNREAVDGFLRDFFPVIAQTGHDHGVG